MLTVSEGVGLGDLHYSRKQLWSAVRALLTDASLEDRLSDAFMTAQGFVIPSGVPGDVQDRVSRLRTRMTGGSQNGVEDALRETLNQMSAEGLAECANEILALAQVVDAICQSGLAGSPPRDDLALRRERMRTLEG